MDVLLLGPMPTPAVAMLTKSMRADLGVMISASHNLFEDNGIKLFGPQGFKLSDDVEKQIEQLLDESSTRNWRRAPASAAPAASTASMTATSNSPSARCRAISASTPARGDRLRQWRGLQGGAGSAVELGADVISIGVDPTLQHQQGVRIDLAGGALPQGARMRADIGIALDGDADRVILVDERGHLVDGDQLLAVIAQSWKEDGRLAKPASSRP